MTDVLIFGVTPEMIHHWGWFLAFGIVLLALGIAAIVRSVAATVASMLFFGWLADFWQHLSVCRCVYGWELGRVLPARAGGNCVRYNRDPHADQAGHKRGGIDIADVDVFPDRGTVSIDCFVVGSPAGLGVAGTERGRHSDFGRSRRGRMAGLRPLGDRPFRWNRSGFLRLGLDYAGNRPPQDVT